MNIDDPSFQLRASSVLAKARIIASEVTTWADFSNAIFAPGGIAAVEFPTKEEREAWLYTWQYKTVHRIQRELMVKFGTVDGATPKNPPPMELEDWQK